MDLDNISLFVYNIKHIQTVFDNIYNSYHNIAFI